MEEDRTFPHIEVLRIGHRPERDKRITTHVTLVARAFGANGIHIDTRDGILESTVERVNKQFGGDFFIRTGVSPGKVTGRWNGTIVHLTMYGMPLDEAVKEIPMDERLLVIVGAEKVPRYIYDVAHFNVSVANQPHSEVSALALFLDRMFEGRELKMDLEGGEIRIEPTRKGKTVVSSGNGDIRVLDPYSRKWPSIPDPETCMELLEAFGCPGSVIHHSRIVRDLGMEMVRSSLEKFPDRGLDIDEELLEAGLLLHDLGRSVTHSVSHITHGVRLARTIELDERLVGMIHNHIGAGVTSDEAASIGLPPIDHLPTTLMERVVCHADTLVGENRRRSLKEAVKKLLDKGAEAGARRVIELHERLEEELGIDIDVLAGPTPKDY